MSDGLQLLHSIERATGALARLSGIWDRQRQTAINQELVNAQLHLAEKSQAFIAENVERYNPELLEPQTQGDYFDRNVADMHVETRYWPQMPNAYQLHMNEAWTEVVESFSSDEGRQAAEAWMREFVLERTAAVSQTSAAKERTRLQANAIEGIKRAVTLKDRELLREILAETDAVAMDPALKKQHELNALRQIQYLSLRDTLVEIGPEAGLEWLEDATPEQLAEAPWGKDFDGEPLGLTDETRRLLRSALEGEAEKQRIQNDRREQAAADEQSEKATRMWGVRTGTVEDDQNEGPLTAHRLAFGMEFAMLRRHNQPLFRTYFDRIEALNKAAEGRPLTDEEQRVEQARILTANYIRRMKAGNDSHAQVEGDILNDLTAGIFLDTDATPLMAMNDQTRANPPAPAERVGVEMIELAELEPGEKTMITDNYTSWYRDQVGKGQEPTLEQARQAASNLLEPQLGRRVRSIIVQRHEDRFLRPDRRNLTDSEEEQLDITAGRFMGLMTDEALALVYHRPPGGVVPIDGTREDGTVNPDKLRRLFLEGRSLRDLNEREKKVLDGRVQLILIADAQEKDFIASNPGEGGLRRRAIDASGAMLFQDSDGTWWKIIVRGQRLDRFGDLKGGDEVWHRRDETSGKWVGVSGGPARPAGPEPRPE